MVSDGFTQSEVGTADPSVTKMPGWPRSSCRSSSAEVAGSSPRRQEESGWALYAFPPPFQRRCWARPSFSTIALNAASEAFQPCCVSGAVG
jgi:hypothetical protein